jgi:alpha-L-rhamnosidase
MMNESVNFERAKPIWPTGRGEVWNLMVGFHARWTPASPDAPVTLRVTGADVYRVWCNGHYVGYGPARTAHGFARVDEWPLDRWVQSDLNHLAIEVL